MSRSTAGQSSGTLRSRNQSKAKSKVWPNQNGSKLSSCDCMELLHSHCGGKVKKSLGTLVVLMSLAVLVWNEKRAVENSRSYHDGLGSVTSVSNPEDFSEDNEGNLIHVCGPLKILEPLEDLNYGVSIYAVKLKRRVQMYQWAEEKVNEMDIGLIPAANSVRYGKVWKDKLSDSSNFIHPQGHENPKVMSVQSEIMVNPQVYLGKYKLGPAFKDKFKDFVQITSGERPETPDIKMHMGLYYHTKDIWNPSVGDIRIQFSFAGTTNGFVSVVAMQQGEELVPFLTNSGASIAFMHEGKKHHLDIFHQEHSPIARSSWVYRVGTFAMTTVGTYMVSRIIVPPRKRNHVARNFLAMGPQKFSIVVAGFVCCSVAGCIWLPHKPAFGSLLVIFGCCLMLYYAIIGPDLAISAKIALPQYTQIKL